MSMIREYQLREYVAHNSIGCPELGVRGLAYGTLIVKIPEISVVITLVLAFVFLHERFTIKSLVSCMLIGLGTLIMVL